MKNKIKIFTLAVLVFTIVLSLLRSLCMLTSYDLSIRYFERGFLPMLQSLLYALGFLGCLVPLFLFPKGSVDCARSLGRGGSLTAKICAVLFGVSGALLAVYGAANIMKLEIFAGLLAIVSALFFFFSSMSFYPSWSKIVDSACPWLCIPTMATLILLLTSTYFDMTTTINGPFTTLFLFSALCGTVFFLCEMRNAIGRPAPRLHFIATLATVFLTVSSSVGNLVFCFFVSNGAERTASDPFRHLLLLSVGIYAIVRLFCFKSASSVKTDDNASADVNIDGENQQFQK